MNAFSKLKTRLAFFCLVGGLVSPSFAAAAVPSYLNDDYVLILSVPFEAPDEVTVTYTSGGGEFERIVSLDENVRLSISSLDLESEDIAFDLSQTSDGFALTLGTHPEGALSPILGFLSDLSTIALTQESTVRFSSTVPGSTLGVFSVSDKENPEISIEGEEPLPFVQAGVLRIEFQKQAEAEEDPSAEDSESGGGCSLGANAATASAAWLALLPLALATVIRKRASR